MYSSIANAVYLFLYLQIAIRRFYVYENNERFSTISVLKHAEGHYIYRSHLLKVMKKTVWLVNPIFYLKTLVRFSQTARACSKTFRERWEDSHDIIATVLSYILGELKL